MPPREYWVVFSGKIGDNLYVWGMADVGAKSAWNDDEDGVTQNELS